MIKVECVSCKSPYDVDERRIPEKGMRMRCPKCTTSFMVDRTGKTSALGSAPTGAVKKDPPAPQPTAAVKALSLPPALASDLTGPLELQGPQPDVPALRQPSAAGAAPPVQQPSAAGAFAPRPPASAAASAFKRTLLGQTAPTAPASSPPGPPTATAPRVPAASAPKPASDFPQLTDLPAVKPATKPAVPWGSLAPPSAEVKHAPARSGQTGLPKGAMSVPNTPPLTAAGTSSPKPSSAGSAFGSVAKQQPSLLGTARAKAPELALGEAAFALEEPTADLRAPQPDDADSPELPVVDLPAAKHSAPANAFTSATKLMPAPGSPAAKPLPPLAAAIKRPGATMLGPAVVEPEVQLLDLPAPKAGPPLPPFPGLPPRAAAPTKAAAATEDAPILDLPAPKRAPLAPGKPPFPPAPPVPRGKAASTLLGDEPAEPAAFSGGGVQAPTSAGDGFDADSEFGDIAFDEPLIDLPAPLQIDRAGAKSTMIGAGAKFSPSTATRSPRGDLDKSVDLGVDLPTPKGGAAGRPGRFAPNDSELDLPAPKAIVDLPAPKSGADLPAPRGIIDLPAPKGITDLPAPKGIADLPAPRVIADLPAPRGIADLPTPKGVTDLPTPKTQGGFGDLDLPVPRLTSNDDEASFGDLDLPELPILPGFGNVELPMPRAGGDISSSNAATRHGLGRGAEESSFGGLDLDGANEFEASLDDLRSDDLLQLKGESGASHSMPAALGHESTEDYGEAGLLDDDGEDSMEFGIAEGEAEQGFALPPELLRRNKGEAAQAAEAARGKRAWHVLIGVSVGLVLLAAAGAGLGVTDYGFFGVYFLERYLPEAGDARFARDAIARSEKTAVSDTYRDVQRALGELGEARHKAGLNRELWTRSLVHEALFMIRFGAQPNSAARSAAIMSRLDERHGLAPGMDLARAADATRRGQYSDAEKFLSKARIEAPQDAYVGLLGGELALAQGKLAEADKAFADARKHAGGARAQWGLARVALGRTDDAARVAAIEETLKLSPLHAEARLAHARILWNQGKDERALSELRQSLGQEPVGEQYLWTSKAAKAGGYSLLGYIDEARGRLHPARKAYEDALAADPYLVEALLGAGRVLLRDHRFNDALARFESGLSLAQKAGNSIVLSGRRADVEARLGQGRAQLALNRAPDAKNTLTALLKDTPNDPEIVLASGQVEDALHNRSGAEELLKKAVELSPNSFAGYLALSQHYFKLNQPDKASETLNEAASKVEENVEMRRMLGQAELARNRYDSAVHEFKRAVELEPQDLDAQFGLAVAYRKLGELDKARTLFDAIALRDAQFAGLALERGQLLEAQGMYDKAVDSYRLARDRDPSDSGLTLRLGAAQVEAGMLDDADQTLQTVMRETPNSPDAEYFMGRLALARGRGPDALTHIDRALSLDGSQAVYHLYAARAALEMTNLGRAIEEAEAALVREPKLGDAYWIRGIVRMRSGAVKDALKDAKRALELNPQRFDAYALMAESFDELRQLPQAIEAYHHALERDPQRAEWWYKLGRLHLDMGDRAHSNEALEKAIALGDKREPMPYWLPDAFRLSAEIARASDRKLAVTLFKRYLKLAPDGALDREDVRKLLASWDVDLSDQE
jgi:predicted Zn finger-like uncharacterized protein